MHPFESYCFDLDECLDNPCQENSSQGSLIFTEPFRKAPSTYAGCPFSRERLSRRSDMCSDLLFNQCLVFVFIGGKTYQSKSSDSIFLT